MSADNYVISKRIKLAFVVGVPLMLAVACSSNELTCAEGSTSNACRISGDRSTELSTGSIQPRPEDARYTIASVPPIIAAPKLGPSQPQLQQANTAARRELRLRRIREAKYRRFEFCDATGSIGRNNRYLLPARRPSLAAATSRRTARAIEHTVAPGETLYTIAHRYGASVAEIASFNVIENTARIKSGTTILIPPS